jgi:hypothetical protein
MRPLKALLAAFLVGLLLGAVLGGRLAVMKRDASVPIGDYDDAVWRGQQCSARLMIEESRHRSGAVANVRMVPMPFRTLRSLR